MKKVITVWRRLLVSIAFCAAAFAQENTPSQNMETRAPSPSMTSTQDQNVQEYVELLRSDVRHQKAEIMGAVMQLDADQAAKFWPIYSDYNAELTKLNNLRLANIEEYARTYDQMTDPKADELVRNAMNYHQQRSDLLAKYYDRVKTSLGPIEAARFVQIEDQLLMIIDLQIASALPIAHQGP
jgi:hypothetical protein